MYSPAKKTENTPERSFITKMFLLVFFTAAVASSLGFMQGQEELVSSEVKGDQLAAALAGNYKITHKDNAYWATPVGGGAETQVYAHGSKDNGWNFYTKKLGEGDSLGWMDDTSIDKLKGVKKGEKSEVQCSKDSKNEKCRNKCTTTYADAGKGAVTESTYEKNTKLMSFINSLIKNKCTTATKKQVADAACLTDAIVAPTTDEDDANLVNQQEIRDGKLYVDGELKSTKLEKGQGVVKIKNTKSCQTLLKRLKEYVKSEYDSATNKTAKEASKYIGVLNCVRSSSTEAYACSPKKDGAGGADFCKKNPSLCTNGQPDPKKIYNKGMQDGGNYGGGGGGGSGLGSGSGQQMPKMPGGGSGGGGGGGDSQQKSESCQSSYYRFFHKEECGEKGKKPTCLLVLNKSIVNTGTAVKMKWQTEHAKSVSFTTTTGANVAYTADGGEVNIYPTKSGNVTLTATGDGDGNTCSKTMSVSVSGSGSGSTEEGAYPPRVSCIPGAIKEGSNTRVTVSWSCSGGSPTSSEGTNFSTGGAVVDTAEVQPTTSTNYEVSCIKGGEVIGKNSCTVLVESSIFDIIVWPAVAGEDEKVRVTWGSLGMTSCRVTGPNAFLYDQQNGVVTTTPFPASSTETEAVYTIECASKFGGSVTRDVVVDKE